jgi:L-alanine-DL-glutamate epimerase-like enolase superfamily enzyme
VFVKVETDEGVHGIGEGTLTNIRPPDSVRYYHG